MQIGFSSTGDFEKTIGWINRVTNRSPETTLRKAGGMGKSALAVSTPKDSGETANSWHYKTKKTASGVDLIFYNTAHAEDGVNIALMLQFGHGTGTGGYVPGRDYINPAMKSVFEFAGSGLVKELIR